MKIGGSKIGGIFAGRNLKSDFHKHHFIVLVLSAHEPFRIGYSDGTFAVGKVALIPQDFWYSLATEQNSLTFFAHFDPYTSAGFQISPFAKQIQLLNDDDFLPVMERLHSWSNGPDPVSDEVERLMLALLAVVTANHESPRRFDSRILSVVEAIDTLDLDSIDLREVASSVFLSPSRFSHLFKQETGVTFRRFIQHRKLVRSLKLLHKESSLTEIALGGGFSDQPHFTKTFVRSFGITPSKSKE